MQSWEIDTERRTATVSILFCDLVASTERQQHLGDDAADEFRRKFFGALYAATNATHGDVVKNTGDGLMVVFRDSAVDAVACASRMHDEVETLDVVPTAFLRVGISAGEAACEHDDWFGTPVVEAARLCAIANAGQTLVAEVVRALVGTHGGHELRSVGPVRIKGIAKPLAVADVVRAAAFAPRPRRTARWDGRIRIWVAAIAALAVLTAVATGLAVVATRSNAATPDLDKPEYSPRIVTTACASSIRALVANATCGSLLVPEDRSRPKGRWIGVKFVRYPARHTTSAEEEPVIELATAVDNAEIIDDPAQAAVRDETDLIVFGGRGLGSSSPSLTCPEFAAIAPGILRAPANDRSTMVRGESALRGCHDRFVHAGFALDHYSTADEAGDVIDLMRALHVRRANLQGVWDSARVALDVARQAPDAVRSLMLLDPEVPRSSYLTNPVTALSTAFDRYVALCTADTTCRRAYPNLDRDFADDVARQAGHPETVVPADLISGTLQVSQAHPPVLLDGNRVAQGLAAALTSSSRNMPLVAAGIEHPNAMLNASLALAQNFPLVLKDFAWGGFLSRMCSYEIHTRSAGATLAATTRPAFAGYDDPSIRWMCAAWSVPQLQPSAFAPVSSDAPTLVVEQQLDPHADPSAVTQLRAGLPNLGVLSFATLPGGALPGDFPTCYNDLRRQFVRDPSSKLDTGACERQSPRINFVVPSS